MNETRLFAREAVRCLHKGSWQPDVSHDIATMLRPPPNVWPSHQIWWRLRSWPKSFRILLRHICFYRGSPYVPTWVQPCLHVRDSRHCSRIVYYLSTLVQHLQLTMETLLRKGRRGLLPISYTQTLNDLLARWTNLAVVLVISKIII